MAKNYTYPRVAISSTAKVHSSVQPAVADTTVMFVPLVTEKGPDREIVRIHSLSEFIGTFGNLTYERNGQQALNVYNWLRNGGTCYVYRIAGHRQENGEDRQTKAIITGEEKSIWSSNVTYKNDYIFDDFTLDDLSANIENATYFIDKKSQRVLYFVPDNDVDATNEDRIIYVPAPAGFDKTKPAAGNYYFIADGVKNVDGLVVPAGKDEPIVVKNAFFVVDKDDTAATAAVALYWTEKNTATDVPEVFGHAKYFGEYYNNLSVNVKILNVTKNAETKEIENVSFNLTVLESVKVSAVQTAVTTVESFPRRNLNNYKAALVSSDYIGIDFDITDSILAKAAAGETNFTYYFSDADDAGIVSDIAYTADGELDANNSALSLFWADTSEYGPSIVLGNSVETPIDIMFDAGYPVDIKKAMMNFINNNNDSSARNDIVGIFDTYELGVDKHGKIGYLQSPRFHDWSEYNDGTCVATNIALYEQYFLVSDELMTGQNIYVTPTYFLAKLISYNDMNYGIQFPTAGIRRGILDDAEAIFSNPTADEKEAMFTSRINYAEKTPREYAFMNQRTHDNSSEESYTALSFLNNIRVLEKMKKDLERLGRSYLFEFNDSITLANLSAILNKYVTNWIANRTLASGVVTVAKNPWSDEAVDVTLTIKFNGTIEVISVDITIE